LETAELINLLTQKPEILLDRGSLGYGFSVVEREEGCENVVRRYGAIDQGRQLAQMQRAPRFTPGRSAIPLRALSFSQNMPALLHSAVSLRRLSKIRLDHTPETRPRAERRRTLPWQMRWTRSRTHYREIPSGLRHRLTLGARRCGVFSIPSGGQKDAFYFKTISRVSRYSVSTLAIR
jgi:hypothetical protein